MKSKLSIVLGLMLGSSVGCGSGASRSVSIASPSFATKGVARAATAEVTEFKFCVARVRLEDNSGKARTHLEEDKKKAHDDESTGEIRFAPGLIDVSSGAATDWGTADLPVGFQLSSIRVKVRKDKALCGVDYSVAFNGATTSEDIEFKWRFSPPLPLDASTKQLQLSLDSVVTALRAAADAGTLDKLKDHIEGVEGDGEEVDDRGEHHGGESGESGGSGDKGGHDD